MKAKRKRNRIAAADGEIYPVSEARSRDLWWREWPLVLAVVTLALSLLGKGWIANALDQPVSLIALLTIICGAEMGLDTAASQFTLRPYAND